MHAELLLHRDRVTSVFELLGTKENDITYSLGWALSRSPAFREALLRRIFPNVGVGPVHQIRLQEHKKDAGITDIEIDGEGFLVIIEAKRGWCVPEPDQLGLYANRLVEASGQGKSVALVAMSECKEQYAKSVLAKEVGGLPVHHFGWDQVARMTHLKHATHAEKRLMAELRTYFQRIVKMQKQDSNMVFVVSLGDGVPEDSTASWKDVVVKHNRYFHPVGQGWPKEPPNYIGFRYDGHLQTIHHVEEATVVRDFSSVPGIGLKVCEDHFMYTLGPAIKPSRPVKNGKVYPSGRVWAMLDLLLTCDTVSEARDKTDKRLETEETV